LERRDCYENSPELCRYILWRYEEYLARQAGQAATVDENVRREIWQLRASDSIEHIFPQSPELGGAWDRKMRKGRKHPEPTQRHVGRIGNLLLLPQALNEEARRQGFQSKKEVYERHNLRMVREVLENNDWTLAEIEAREQRIIEWAKTEWCDVSI